MLSLWIANPTSVPKTVAFLKVAAVTAALALAAGCAAPGQNKGDGVAGAGEASDPQGQQAARVATYDPEEFIGYGPQRLLPIMGAPDFVRRDGPAQIWQYRAENCVLDLFLYGQNDDSQVRHVELRERVPGVEPVEQCFSRLRAERESKPAS